MSDSKINFPPQIVIEAFTSASITALQELIDVSAQYKQCQTFAEVDSSEAIIVATIELLRENPGSMSLLLSPEAASQLAAQYLPTGSMLTPDIIDDVAGEFANVIAGQTKTMLKGTAYHFHISTPNVKRIKGLELSLRPSSWMLITLVAPEIGPIRLAIELPTGAEITSSE